MIDAEIERLLGRPMDHGLEGLEANIWAGVAEQERSVRHSRRLLALQAVLLAFTLIGALLVGKYAGSAGDAGVDIFSPHMALSASTLLAGGQP